MNLHHQRLQAQTRRHFLKNCQVGLGGLALSQLLARDTQAAPKLDLSGLPDPLAPKKP